MAYYLCKKCGAVYEKETKFCGDILCRGTCFEIDENMIVPIMHLLNKGYKTLYCCSGHISSDSCGGYIAFALGKEPNTAPKGWTIDNDKRCIRYLFPYNKQGEANAKEKYKTILQKMTALNKWCEELPYLKEEKDEQ